MDPQTQPQIHVLVRHTGEYADAESVPIAALSSEEEASRLLQVYERVGEDHPTSGQPEYEVVALPLYASAAEALGL
ncbi:MAG TPA: hypothetical protein VKZ89_18885 [Thermobifida alba]|nr:hypothetical protein [Thermobifida alba]